MGRLGRNIIKNSLSISGAVRSVFAAVTISGSVAMFGVPGPAYANDRQYGSESLPLINPLKTARDAAALKAKKLRIAKLKKLRSKRIGPAVASQKIHVTTYTQQVTTPRVIYGRSIWVCTPSGFGRRASCSSRL